MGGGGRRDQIPDGGGRQGFRPVPSSRGRLRVRAVAGVHGLRRRGKGSDSERAHVLHQEVHARRLATLEGDDRRGSRVPHDAPKGGQLLHRPRARRRVLHLAR